MHLIWAVIYQEMPKWLEFCPLFSLAWYHVFSHVRCQCHSHRALLTTISLKELQAQKLFLKYWLQFLIIFNEWFLLICAAKTWQLRTPGVPNFSCITFSLFQCWGEGEQLPFCHTATKQKVQHIFNLYSLFGQDFPLTASSFFSLCILLEFVFLTLCLCSLLELPGNLTRNWVFFPMGNMQTFFF